jgi:hypothetical protein
MRRSCVRPLKGDRRGAMRKIYITNKGDDQNDGLSRETAVKTWAGATVARRKANLGNAEIDIAEDARERIKAEVAAKKKP